MMHATKMIFAFVQAADTKTDLGRRVLAIAVRQHEEMLAELKAKDEAKNKPETQVVVAG
jgi:hypothetical protein